MHKDYSQHGEQQVILDYFGDRKGVLMDIGANDGETFSNSRALMLQGWKGLFFEPGQEAFNRLWNLYQSNPNAAVVKAGIGNTTGEVSFFASGSLMPAAVDTGLVSSFIEGETSRWKQVTKPEHRVVEYKQTTAFMVKWSHVVAQGVGDTHFITIDTEGFDLAILAQLDLDALKCELLCVEYNGRDEDKYTALVPFPLIYKNKTNLIYGRNKLHI